MEPEQPHPRVPIRELVRYYLRLGLIVLFRWKVSNPLLIAAAAVIGLVAFPLLQPTWVFVK